MPASLVGPHCDPTIDSNRQHNLKSRTSASTMYGSTGGAAARGTEARGADAELHTGLLQGDVGAAERGGLGGGGGSTASQDGLSAQPSQAHEHKNQLGVFNGVFVPCLLNILGVILFLRIGWAVGHAGWMEVLMMFAVGECLALLTVLSMAAIVSNGNMKGGGSYYLISRSLGPEFGGSIGLLFYSAYAVGTSFYVIGFATEIVEAFLVDDATSRDDKQLYTVVIASAALAVVMLISMLGAGFFTKINGLVFAVQFGSIVLGICSMYFRPGFQDDLENGGQFVGANTETLRHNMWSNYTVDDKCGREQCSFKLVLAILFPAMTGIMEGANLSGDLKNPNHDIGRGTIAAVFGAITTYVLLIFGFAAGFPRDTLKTNMNVMENVTWPTKYCIIVGISVSAFSSALGSVFGGSRVLQALGRDNLPPGWGLHIFAKGSVVGDEPRRAVAFSWLVAQCACLIGDIDVISPIIASFFLLSYGTVNLTCLLLDLSGTPNFRPHFRYYSRAQALLGFVLCIGTLFFLDVWYAVISCSFLLVLFFYISYRSPVKSWGDVSQSLLYHQVRKYLLRLDLEDHPKNWRPSILLLFGPGNVNLPIIDFCNSLKKGGLYTIGDAVIGDLDQASEEITQLRVSWLDLIKYLSIKAIPEVTFAPSTRMAFQQLVLLSGLGGMKPNCVALLLPLAFGGPNAGHLTPDLRVRRHALLLREPTEASECADQASSGSRSATPDTPVVPAYANEGDFVDVLRDVVVAFQKNLLLACNFDAQFHTCKSNAYIDVWIIGADLTLDGSLSLSLQLAHILRLERRGTIRLFNIVDEFCDIASQAQGLANLASRVRLHGATSHVIACHGGIRSIDECFATESLIDEIRRIILSNSQANTRVSFLALPSLPVVPEKPGAQQHHDLLQGQQQQQQQQQLDQGGAEGTSSSRDRTDDTRFVRTLQALVQGLPPVVLVRSGRRTNMIPEEL